MSQKFRVVTLNTWKCDGQFTDRLRWMADGLVRLRPDIVCLQEAFMCEEAGVDTAAFLAERLTKKLEVLSARQKTRSFRGKPRESWSNLAILSNDRLRRLADVKLFESELDQDRWAMQASTTLPSGERIRVINTHLTHVRGDEGVSARKRQAQQLAELCASPTPDVTVLCGDFNALWKSPDLSALSALQFEKPAQELSGGTWLGERIGSTDRSRRIDFVEVLSHTPGAARVASRMPALNAPVGPNGEFPSDHAALVADIFLSARDTARSCLSEALDLEARR